MPTTAQFVVALLDVARAQGPLEAAELDRLAAEGLGVSNDDPVIQEMLDQLAERLADEGGPLALLAGGGPPGIDVMAYAEARALDSDDEGSMAAAMADPLVLDAVLHEGGWFDRFLAERGPLLPADEALLAQTWTLVDRSVYEVLDVDAGNGVRVRDLRTGDELDVRERTASRQASPGQLLCGRAVPDGESRQFVGGLFGVPPGRESTLLDLLDPRDGLHLLEYVTALHRPPDLVCPTEAVGTWPA